MLPLKKSKKLKKELKLLDVYSIATGTTLSAGFFLLPGLAAIQAGPALTAAYLIAAIPFAKAISSVQFSANATAGRIKNMVSSLFIIFAHND